MDPSAQYSWRHLTTKLRRPSAGKIEEYLRKNEIGEWDPDEVARSGFRCTCLGTLSLLGTAMLHLTGQVLGKWSGSGILLRYKFSFDLFSGFVRFLYHGRRATDIPQAAHMDVSKTCGLFFSMSYEKISVSPGQSLPEQIKGVSSQVADQGLQPTVRRGSPEIGYGHHVSVSSLSNALVVPSG